MRKQPAVWAALQIFRRLCNALPHRIAIALGDALGRAVGRYAKEKAMKARARCSRVLGVDEHEAERIVAASYGHFGRSLVEFMRMPKMVGCLDEVVTLEGEGNLKEALDLGRGVILLSAHIGNWEYGAALLARRGFPVNAIGAEQRDPRITDAIDDLRRAGGVRPLGKGIDLREAISCLKRGEVLAVLLDQDARDRGVVSPFLGFPASTPLGPIRLSRKFGCPVVPIHAVRSADGWRFTTKIEPMLSGREGEPFGEDIQYAVDRCNEVISGWIRENPEQWMWMYPRWATTLGDR